MPGIATGETYAFPDGKLYLYASASGTASGSGVGYVENARLTFTYGWGEWGTLNAVKLRVLTGRRAELSIDTVYADLTFFRLVQASAAVNAKFEGLTTGVGTRSAQFILYSGVIDSFSVVQARRDLFKASYGMHAEQWSAFGQ